MPPAPTGPASRRASPADDDGRLFRALFLTFAPTLVAGALATRAWALPASDLPPDQAARYLDLGVGRIVLPEAERPHLMTPADPPTKAAPPRPAPRAGSGEPKPAAADGAAGRLLDALGSLSGTAVSPIGSDEDRVMEALARVGADDRAARGAPDGLRAGSGRPGDAAEGISLVGAGSSAPALSTGGPDLAIRRARVASEPAGGGGTPAPEIGSIIKGYRGRIEACAQTALHSDPETAGRIELAWSVSGGRAHDVRIVGNTTDNEELSACISRAVRSMAFPSGLSAAVDGYTWIVSGV